MGASKFGGGADTNLQFTKKDPVIHDKNGVYVRML